MRQFSWLLILCLNSARAQDRTFLGSTANGFNGSAHFTAPPPFAGRAVTGAPYSGEESFERVQTLPDGTHITYNPPPNKLYRDSFGRTRSERPFMPNAVRARHTQVEAPFIIEINDPVARVRYILDTVNKIAHRQQLAPLPERPSQVSAPAGTGGFVGSGVTSTTEVSRGIIAAPPPPNSPANGPLSSHPVSHTSNESLGTTAIEGVLAEGHRTTITWPVDSIGNDQPISNVTELWTSPELGVIVLRTTTDPRFGPSTQKLTNISRSEPPADLFQPPPDYTIVDETGEFTIRWGPSQ